jgi:hypothetical protein
MSGLLSAIGSAATSFATNITNDATSVISSLNPSVNQGAVVGNMQTFPPIFDNSQSGAASFNPNYAIHLMGQDELGNNVDILASLPEHFSYHVTSDWQSLLANPSLIAMAANSGILGGTGSQIAGIVGAAITGATGYTDYPQAATQQVWHATSPLQLNFPMVFNAIYDPTQEVTQPIMELTRLVVPSNGVGVHTGYSALNAALAKAPVLKAPGPNLLDATNGKGYKIQLRIGQCMVFDNVIVTSVSPMYDTMAHQTGDFISAQVDVSFITTTILTKTDIENMFINLVAQGTGSTSATPVFSASQLAQHQG